MSARMINSIATPSPAQIRATCIGWPWPWENRHPVHVDDWPEWITEDCDYAWQDDESHLFYKLNLIWLGAGLGHPNEVARELHESEAPDLPHILEQSDLNDLEQYVCYALTDQAEGTVLHAIALWNTDCNTMVDDDGTHYQRYAHQLLGIVDPAAILWEDASRTVHDLLPCSVTCGEDELGACPGEPTCPDYRPGMGGDDAKRTNACEG